MEFSQWWTKEMRTVKLPAQGTVFDYFLDPQTRRFLPWSDAVQPFVLEPDVPLQVRAQASSGSGKVKVGGGGCKWEKVGEVFFLSS